MNGLNHDAVLQLQKSIRPGPGYSFYTWSRTRGPSRTTQKEPYGMSMA